MAALDVFAGISALLAATSASISGVSAYYNKENNNASLALQREELRENLRSNYYSYMQSLEGMRSDLTQAGLSRNQTIENLGTNNNYLARWAQEYDTTMNSVIDQSFDEYTNMYSNFTSNSVLDAEKGRKGGTAARVNRDNLLSLVSLTGRQDGKFNLTQGSLGQYMQSTALDMLSDKQTALSSIQTGYKSLPSYKDTMDILSKSIADMEKTTSEMKKKIDKNDKENG